MDTWNHIGAVKGGEPGGFEIGGLVLEGGGEKRGKRVRVL
jgi:hypothetical protein